MEGETCGGAVTGWKVAYLFNSPMSSTERGSYNERGSYKCDGIPVDPLITTAARALAAGDPLGALKRVALRDDPPALALRGIAMGRWSTDWRAL